MSPDKNYRRNSSPKKRKGKRIKVHYGRLFFQLFLLTLFIGIIIWGIARCATAEDFEDYREPIHEAVEAGRRDAMKVLNTSEGTMERDESLLFIKSREYQLRSNGYGHAADDYIEAARIILVEHGIE